LHYAKVYSANLQPLIENIMGKVSRFFVEERDPLFRKGKLEGIDEGILKGKLEGKLEGLLEGELRQQYATIRNLLLDGTYDVPKIALLAGATVETVLEVKRQLDQNKS
jgi:predicted transposase YdaD